MTPTFEWCDDMGRPRIFCPCGACGGTETGIFDGVSDELYHRDRGSLSSSGARTILHRSPAHFKHERDHGRPPKKAFDRGHAAHTEILGVGAPVAVLDPKIHGLKRDGSVADSPTATTAWKAAEADARARGETPIHIDDWRHIEAMVAVVRSHPLARLLLASGQPEQSIYWRDEQTGVLLRARPDWLHRNKAGRLVVVDYKTTKSARPSDFRKSVGDFGYHQQEAWYRDGVAAVLGEEDPIFVFIAQEIEPPHAVIVAQLDTEDVDLGRRLNRRAIDTYAECVATGTWPAYGDDIQHLALPAWARTQQEESVA